MISAVALVLAVQACTTGAASGSPQAPEAPETTTGSHARSLMAAQGALTAAAERIAAQQDNAFTGFVVSPEQRKLSVYWKGRPPAAAARAIDEARRDVSVEVFDAPYSAEVVPGLVELEVAVPHLSPAMR